MTLQVFPFCTNGTGGDIGANYPDEGLIVSPEFETVINKARNGYEQRSALMSDERYRLKYKWTKQTNDMTVLTTLWAFFVARKARYEAFAMFEFNPSAKWTGLAVGTSTSPVQNFDLNGRNSSSRSIYVNGSPVTTNFSIGTGTGTYGRDRLTTASGFPAGAITEDFVGQRYFVARFDHDSMDMEQFSALLWETSIDMQTLLGE